MNNAIASAVKCLYIMYLHLVLSMSCMYKGPRIMVSPWASKKSGPALRMLIYIN